MFLDRYRDNVCVYMRGATGRHWQTPSTGRRRQLADAVKFVCFGDKKGEKRELETVRLLHTHHVDECLRRSGR